MPLPVLQKIFHIPCRTEQASFVLGARIGNSRGLKAFRPTLPHNPKRKGNRMATNDTYLAVFLGSKTSPRMKAWMALGEAERRAREQEGMAAWKAWVEKHQGAIQAMGGPLGKTKKVTEHGIEDVANEMGAFTVVRADSHEAAAKIFEKHPHFTIFPGECIEIMPVLPIPGT
jgi:hypothetical protein